VHEPVLTPGEVGKGIWNNKSERLLVLRREVELIKER
jgi:hypothetical protein